MRIVVDAMGTDARPTPDVIGAARASQEYSIDVILVGDSSKINEVLSRTRLQSSRISVVHASDQISMTDKPSQVMRSKSDSSMHVGMQLVKNGEANAFVTMGNTGAAHAIATLSVLHRIPKVRRPALTALYRVQDQPMIFLDMGANADSKPEWLQQFGLMGAIYAETVLNLENPRVATLCNGEEEGKGNELTRQAQALMHQLHLNYVGHVEPKELLEGKADVIVVDGFVGNIFLKTFEASISYFADVIRQEVKKSWYSSLGALLMRPALRNVRQRLDTGEIGGAPLLGVNGVVIIGHGRADEHAVKNAINQARLAAQAHIVSKIVEGMQSLDARSESLEIHRRSV